MAQPETHRIRDQAGAQSLVGYVLDVSPAERCVRARLEVEDRHANRNGMLHGGIIAMLLDAACGFTASMRLGGDVLTPLVTVSLTTQFVAGAGVGSHVTATGFASGAGRKIAYVQGELRDGDDRLIATASGVFRRISGRLA